MLDRTSGTPKTKTASLTNSATGMDALRTVEEGLGTAGQEIWKIFHELPYQGAGAGFALGLGAATLVGVAELATACFTAYVSYRMFAYGESLTDAIEKTIKFEGGTLPKTEIEKHVKK